MNKYKIINSTMEGKSITGCIKFGELENDYYDAKNKKIGLKYTKTNLTPLQLNDLYVNYIKLWNDKKKLSESLVSDTIRDRYVELLKEITLDTLLNPVLLHIVLIW